MPSQSHELFALSSSTPGGSAFHGQAAARARAEAGASFRRGIDLSAEFDFRADVQGSVGKELAATFSGGLAREGGSRWRRRSPSTSSPRPAWWRGSRPSWRPWPTCAPPSAWGSTSSIEGCTAGSPTDR